MSAYLSSFLTATAAASSFGVTPPSVPPSFSVGGRREGGREGEMVSFRGKEYQSNRPRTSWPLWAACLEGEEEGREGGKEGEKKEEVNVRY